jgi:hypothetical protein
MQREFNGEFRTLCARPAFGVNDIVMSTPSVKGLKQTQLR